MTMILYHGEPNGPSLAALAASFESGLDIERRRIDLLAGERHRIPGLTAPVARDLGVEGEGPVLVIDGEAMTESVFIAQFFDEAAGGAGLQPRDPHTHWQMLMWCRRVTERAAPAEAYLGCRAFAHPLLAAMSDDAFAALTADIVSDDLRARWHDVRRGNFPDAQTQDSLAKHAANIDAIEAQLDDGRDWLIGDFSIADLETFGWLSGSAVADAFVARPLTQAWMDRVASRRSVKAALALASVSDARQSWAPGPEINRWG